ncbi:hypothetical protein SAMN05428975_0315 [Mucilaginibacter sp. OK268]|nr:hypothetical protein SAMN05428975_0315 [Mucilaginibacter sp. OK268]
MTLAQLADTLNRKARSGNHAIARLPELRKQYLHKKQLPADLFTRTTIFDKDDKYFFHHGGRDEMQFNVGEEWVNNRIVTRYGLCFSLEPSRSLTNPVHDLKPFQQRFNQCLAVHPAWFKGFKQWYYRHGNRSVNQAAQPLNGDWFLHGNFICLGGIINKSLTALNDQDLQKILAAFDRLLPIYEYVVLQKKPLPVIRIFTRLTSNENNWELPSPHRWKKSNQGKKNIPFENQYGFGHEEWLLNNRYNVGGYQYGYIRGIQHAKAGTDAFAEVHFYTVRKEKTANLVYHVGTIRNLEIIKHDPAAQEIIKPVIDRFRADMIEEILQINGDRKGMDDHPFTAVARFKLQDVDFPDEPVYQPEFDLKTFKRFQPYEFEGDFADVFEEELPGDSTEFIAGKATQTSVYNKKNRDASITVEKLHTEIVECLEQHLLPGYSVSRDNLSIEIMRFHGNIADVVTLDRKKSISIYEIKTSASGRRNIRDAIAQLLDYAAHAGTLKVKILVVVSPSWLNALELAFLKHLQDSLAYKLEYYCYDKNRSPKFILQG